MNYIRRSVEGIEISYKGCFEEINRSLIDYINDLCINNLSTYHGRLNASKKILNSKINLPIYVNESLFLFPTESVRKASCFFLNYYEILSIKAIRDNKSKIVFLDLSVLILEISHLRIQKQMEKVEIMLNYII